MTDNKAKKVKKSTSKNTEIVKATKSTKSTNVEPADPTPVEPTDPTPVEPTESVPNSITSTPKEILNTLINESKEMVTSTKKMILLLKNLCKTYDKSLKMLHKTTRKNKKRDVHSKPNKCTAHSRNSIVGRSPCSLYLRNSMLVGRKNITAENCY